MFEGKKCIIIVGIWLLIGLLSVMLVCVRDMRGKPYDENYFKGGAHYVISLILMGGFSFFFSHLAFFEKDIRNERVIKYSQNSFIK